MEKKDLEILKVHLKCIKIYSRDNPTEVSREQFGAAIGVPSTTSVVCRVHLLKKLADFIVLQREADCSWQ